jgi:uncharacterized protein (TIGR03790 family)
VNNFLRCLPVLLALGLPAARLSAGGSGLNVVVVVNQASSNSVQLGNYYCEQRGVPPQNLLRINWSGGTVEWTRTEFETTLLAPLTTMLASRRLTNQVDYVLLSMDIPYRVTNNMGSVNHNFNSTSSALFYGFKDNPIDPYISCTLASAGSNAYAGSEGIFRQTPPVNILSNSWMVMMLTSSNLAQTKALVDRGVAGDSSFPALPVALAKSQDRLRNIRFYHHDSALLDVQLRGGMNILRTNTSTPIGLGTLLGYQTGEQIVNLATNLFVPGALADNLTSYGGLIFEDSGHTDALDFLNAGATASYGTVVEPCNYFEKFASPQLYFYQSRGYSSAECYYLSVTNPYQGLLVGEPLTAPFAVPASGEWVSPASGDILSGTMNLIVSFSAASASRPLQQVDLFLDGDFCGTLTNLPPGANNTVSVTINGSSTSYRIPAGATIQSVVSNLAGRLNTPSYTNLTKVSASAHGDRIELQSFDLARLGGDTSVTVSSSPGTAGVTTAFLAASRSNFLDHVAYGLRSYTITNSAGSSVPLDAYLQLLVVKTNGAVVTVSLTNTVPGTPLNLFARALFDAANSNVVLQAADGLVVEDINLHEDWPYNQYVYGSNDFSGEFNLRARSVGWPEAQVRACLSGSPALLIEPPGTNGLDENLSDLQPRNHLYLTAGLPNLDFAFPLNTTTNADGYHELTAVAYEGSHVRTQCRVSQNIIIQNNAWSALLTTLIGGTNTALEATLQFAVTATIGNIARIELFTTGGLFAATNNVSSATFTIAATDLGIGRHPFYALVTGADGTQYRTETQWLRIVGNELPFAVSVAGKPPTLTWPASAGRNYQVLSTPDLTTTFAPRAVVTPTNSTGSWSETNSTSPQRLYRVKTP